MLKQREAVFAAVMKHSKGSKKLTFEMRQKIYAQLEKEFHEGRIELRANQSNMEKLAEPRLLRSYVIGLVGNWLRKDERLVKKVKSAA